MFKKTPLFAIFALSALAFNTNTYAFIPFVDEDTKPETLEVGFTGGFFKLSPDFRAYATQKTSAGSLLTDTSLLKVNPRYRLGGGIDVIYGSSYKVNAIYFEVDNKRTRIASGVLGPLLLPASWASGLSDTFVNNASSTLKSRYRFLTLSVSNSFTLSCFTLTPSLGLSYLYLRHNQNAYYANFGGTEVFAEAQLNSKFYGLGPTFAANFGYEFCGGFSLIGGLQYSPLVGDFRGNYKALRSTSTTTSTPTNTNINFSYKTRSTIVSHVQSELGFGYIVPMNKCFTGNISLVYRFVKMVGGRETILFSDPFNAHANNSITNSVLHGPLLRVAIKYKLS